MTGLRDMFGKKPETPPTVSAQTGSMAAGRDIIDSTINIGLGAAEVAHLLGLMLDKKLEERDGRTVSLAIAALQTTEAQHAGAEGVTVKQFLILAQRSNAAVEDDTAALAELTRCVEVAAEVARAGHAGTNTGDFVDRVLARVAELSARSEHDEAARAVDTALADWTERQVEEKQKGMRLLDAGLKQDILRRNAGSAAERVARMVEIELQARASLFKAMREAQYEWYVRGRDKGLNFDLDVSIALARHSHAIAHSADARGAALNDLGIALATLGERESGTARLEEAIAAYHAALEQRTRKRVPLNWAMTQNNLGAALQMLGERESGPERLQEAVKAHRAALLEYTRKRAPLQWAGTQTNLGNALRALGERERGTTRLKDAVAAFRAALGELTRERVPLDWAMTQTNLGAALQTLGAREQRPARLKEAVAAHSDALLVYTRERFPLLWATTQNNIGNALQTLGARESGTARLEEAVAAYRAALHEWTRERVPLDWATTQHNLGAALSMLGARERGTARLEEAVAAFSAALEEHTRARVPLDWAGSTGNQGIALCELALRAGDLAMARQGVAQLRDAIKVLREGGHAAGVATFERMLPAAVALVEMLAQDRT